MSLQMTPQQVELACLIARRGTVRINPTGRILLASGSRLFDPRTWRALVRHGLVRYDRPRQSVSISPEGERFAATIARALEMDRPICPHDAGRTMGSAHV
jgi:hypothetical protein